MSPETCPGSFEAAAAGRWGRAICCSSFLSIANRTPPTLFRLTLETCFSILRTALSSLLSPSCTKHTCLFSAWPHFSLGHTTVYAQHPPGIPFLLFYQPNTTHPRGLGQPHPTHEISLSDCPLGLWLPLQSPVTALRRLTPQKEHFLCSCYPEVWHSAPKKTDRSFRAQTMCPPSFSWIYSKYNAHFFFK